MRRPREIDEQTSGSRDVDKRPLEHKALDYVAAYNMPSGTVKSAVESVEPRDAEDIITTVDMGEVEEES